MPVSVSLLEPESSWKRANDPSITTITFFKGSLAEAAPKIRDRLRAVVKINPWLVGKLVRNKEHKRLQLVYPDKLSLVEEALDDLFCVNAGGIELHPEMPYQALAKAAASAIVQPVRVILNKSSLVTRLTLIADSRDKSSGFAMIFSMSHNISDGHTYYKILHMLSTMEEIEALNPVRKDDIPAKMIDAMGKREWEFFSSFSHAFNALRGALLGKKAKVFAYYIDIDKVDAIKSNAAKEGKVPFVSTNDVLTSSFSSFMDPRLFMMTINFRNKLPGLSGESAGSYSGVVFYDKNGYSAPSTVRNILQGGPPYVGVSGGFPGILESLFCRLGLITNTVAFTLDFAFDGCEEVVHFPLFDFTLLPYDIVYVFRPKRGKLGVMYATRRFDGRHFASSSLPIGGSVSGEIFAC